MLVRGVAMAAAVGGKTIVRSAEVGGSKDDGGARNAPPQVVDTAKLEAGTANLSPLEQRLAQPHRGHPVPCLH